MAGKVIRLGDVDPKPAIGGNATLKAAIRRGGQTFWMVISGFLTGPLLSGLIALVVFAQIESASISAEVMDENGVYSFVGAAVSFLIKTIFYYTSAIGVVVLCDAYRRIEEDELASDDPI